MDEPLRVAHGLVIPAEELRWRFDPSGGPGGQHANKASTRVELAFDVAASPAVPEPMRVVLMERLGARLSGGVLRLVVNESRSQWRNREIARRRLAALLVEALRVRRRRRPTRPSPASRLRRLEEKHRRAEAKRRRRPPATGGPDAPRLTDSEAPGRGPRWKAAGAPSR